VGVRDAQLRIEAIPRDGGEPAAAVARNVALLVALLRGPVHYDWYYRRFELSERQFSRDLQHLRKIGDDLGIRIGRKRNGMVRVEAIEGRNRLADLAPARENVIRAIAWALGAPAAAALDADVSGEPQRNAFLVVAMPRLIDGTRAADLFAALESAFHDAARVRFTYRGRFDELSSRVVEPYRVLVHGGRYFLVGYDIAARKGWRYFALDRIEAIPVRAGSFVRRPIPQSYISGDAIGMMQNGAEPVEVTVRFAPVIAPSVASREWQCGQVVSRRLDGSIDITVRVADGDEAIRWALGFGDAARVVAPPRAVAIANRTALRIAQAYAVSSEALQQADAS
jgi:predicted DNA-binding transcriptional regulator YafY